MRSIRNATRPKTAPRNRDPRRNPKYYLRGRCHPRHLAARPVGSSGRCVRKSADAGRRHPFLCGRPAKGPRGKRHRHHGQDCALVSRSPPSRCAAGHARHHRRSQRDHRLWQLHGRLCGAKTCPSPWRYPHHRLRAAMVHRPLRMRDHAGLESLVPPRNDRHGHPRGRCLRQGLHPARPLAATRPLACPADRGSPSRHGTDTNLRGRSSCHQGGGWNCQPRRSH